MLMCKKIFGNLSLQRTMSFYAVARGHKIGIYDNWVTCKKQVDGFKGAKYKKFPNREAAELFIKEACDAQTTTKYKPETIAVALGKKRTAPLQWNNDAATQQAENKTDDFWPESDGDSFLRDGGITDEELLAAISEVEGINHETPSTNTATNSLKRAIDDKSSGSSASKIPKHASNIVEAAGLKRIGSFEFQIDAQGFVIVYTDGSCINNGAANASAGFGVYFNDNHPLNAAKPVNGRVTNNVGEIQAAIYAIKTANDLNIKKLCISTDSQFLINAITLWVPAWKRKNWRLKDGGPVKNSVDFKELDGLLQNADLEVKWNYVKAHKGIKGNEMADKLAREGSGIYRCLHMK